MLQAKHPLHLHPNTYLVPQLGKYMWACTSLSLWRLTIPRTCLPAQFYLKTLVFFRDRVSLYSPGCPGSHSVEQAGLELRNPPASASRVLGLKACTTTAWPWSSFYFFEIQSILASTPGCSGQQRQQHPLRWVLKLSEKEVEQMLGESVESAELPLGAGMHLKTSSGGWEYA